MVLAVAVLLTSAGVASAVIVIKARAERWSPTSVSISRGSVVKWRAVSGDHNIKAYGGNWSYFRTLPSGSSRSRTFSSAGTFRFYCTLHASVSGGSCSGMCGRVVVA